MKKAILIPSVRYKNYLCKFLDSLIYLPDDWLIYLNLMEYTDYDLKAFLAHPGRGRITGIIRHNTKLPPYLARAEIYRKWTDIDIWCGMDDDMILLPETDLDSMAAKVLEPGNAVVSGNWARTQSLLEKKMLKQEYIQQPLVNMAGGMVYTQLTVEEILRNPIEPYLFCDIQVPLLMYVQGYRNHRYLGSLLIHYIQTKGGLIKTFREIDMTLPPQEYCAVRPCAKMYAPDNNYFMPTAKDITSVAHRLHQERKKYV